MKISTSKFLLFITLFNVIVYHSELYGYIADKVEIFSGSGILILLSVVVILFIVNLLILSILALISRRLLKGFVILSMIGNSVAIYFVSKYEVFLDMSMMGNALNTQTSEAMSFYDPQVFLYILILGIIPSVAVYKIQLEQSKRVKMAIQGVGIFIAGIGILYLNSPTWLWLDKNSKYLGALTMPWSYVSNSIRYELKKAKYNKKQELLPKATFNDNEKTVVVLIIGESARSHNFSLYGYEKETNPLLKKQDIVSIKAISKTTYTTGSINSMFSPNGEIFDSYEPLPSYLQRSGISVLWRTENWGEPPIKVESYLKGGDLASDCKGDGCKYDEKLLTKMNEAITTAENDKVFMVLHTYGNHGPAYNKRYPKKFEKFTPVCESVDLKKCTQESLINAYDNSVVYVDYFVNKTIEEVKKLDRPAVVMFVSDHGESLGEYGLYMHGAPNAIAPDFQR
ncbi:MAG: sulfatase-like hydrolase/transferase, partial [Campylobacterales bacterium]|nr:sulfatase-like hydrolase/transferase [Campylobacterales bacterium]